MTGNGTPDCQDVEIFPIGIFNGKFDSCYDSVSKKNINNPN